jgi:hypothetical protein
MHDFHFALRLRRSRGILATAATAAAVFATPSAMAAPRVDGSAAAFAQENSVAMDKMMSDMTITPSGDIDRDFAAMMIPHHQGAIDMALAELRHGRNEQLRRIAQEIIVEQQQEINAMHLAVGQPLLPPAPAPTQIKFISPASSTDADTAAPPVHVHPTH